MSKRQKASAPFGCLTLVLCLVYFPIGVILELAKSKSKRGKTGGRGHGKKDYWPHN